MAKVKNAQGDVVADVPTDDGDDEKDELIELFKQQRQLGRKAVDIALKVLDRIDPAEIPVNVAVQLLKFGAELERRAALGIEDGDDDGDDPFEALARAAGGGDG